MKGVLFRADGSVRLGLGHFVRCLSLRGALEEKGIPCFFAARALEAGPLAWLESQGVKVERLAAKLDPLADAEATLKAAEKFGADAVVTDLTQSFTLPSPEDSSRFHQKLRDSIFTVCISSDEFVDAPAHVVINPYLGAPASSGNSSALLLSGPAYFIFRPEFLKNRPHNRTISDKAAKVLVAVGGTDQANLTEKILGALMSSSSSDLREVRVFCGGGFSSRQKELLKKKAQGAPFRVEFRGGGDSVAESMVWADAGFIGDGQTKYEAALLGLPVLIFTLLGKRPSLSEKFDGAGSGLFAGSGQTLTEEEISAAASSFLADGALRKKMSEKGFGLTDGRGASRVVEEILRAKSQSGSAGGA